MDKEFSLTKKHSEILYCLYRFRFLSSLHIRELLGHHEPSRVNRWLAELRKNEYIDWDYNKKAGKNKNPGIYFLEKSGLRYIIDTYNIHNAYAQKLRNEEKISFVTKQHSLATADFYLILSAYAKKMNHTLHYYTKADIANLPLYKYIKPDSYFTYETPLGKRSCFIEIDMETESKTTIKKHMKKYNNFYYTNKWKTAYSQNFPSIGIICLTEKRKTVLLHELKDLTPLSFKITTIDQIKKQGISAKIWQSIYFKRIEKLL